MVKDVDNYIPLRGGILVYNDTILKMRRKAMRNNMPKPEQVLWYWLKGRKLNGYKFRRQYSIGYYVVDFYCPELRLVIEVDGDSHFSSEAVIYDRERSNFLASRNIKIVRFTNEEVLKNTESVIYKLMEYLP